MKLIRRAPTTWSLSGLAVLLCDHRNQGASDGAPRRGINLWIQCRGYRDAIRLMRTLCRVDRDRCFRLPRKALQPR